MAGQDLLLCLAACVSWRALLAPSRCHRPPICPPTSSVPVLPQPPTASLHTTSGCLYLAWWLATHFCSSSCSNSYSLCPGHPLSSGCPSTRKPTPVPQGGGAYKPQVTAPPGCTCSLPTGPGWDTPRAETGSCHIPTLGTGGITSRPLNLPNHVFIKHALSTYQCQALC